MERIAEKLRSLPDLSDDERWLYAHSLVLTPDERWERNLQYIRSVNSCVLLPPKLRRLVAAKKVAEADPAKRRRR